MNPTEPPKSSAANPNSLEGSSTVVEGGTAAPPNSSATASTEATPPGNPPARGQPPHRFNPREFFRHINVYLLAFILVVLVAVVILVVSLVKNQKTNNPSISAQNLTQSQLEQIAGSTESVGNTNQVLNIGSNTIINGQVLVQKDLDVAGSVKVGGSLELPGITVSGSSLFQQINTSKLAVSGDTTVQGNLTVGQTLNVAGGATFGGSVSINTLTAQSLQLSGTLTLTHHIAAGGSTPAHSTGSAVGNGGTTSLSGSDTSGSIAINTGSSTAAGCFITITFAQTFNATPHVIISPVDSGAAGLAYYVNRTTTSFSVCTTSTPPTGSSFGFDYIAFD
jgi:cytoskeletal protein CcmA (bactofilin family)